VGDESSEKKSACPHPEAVGKRYGDPIGEERQAELQGTLDAWDAETDHGERTGPFAGVELTGADVYWLVERVRRLGLLGVVGPVPDAHLEGANLSDVHLERANLSEAHLEGADLTRVYLEGADLTRVNLEGADLYRAHLEEVDLYQAHLEGTDLRRAGLNSKTNLTRAVLDVYTSLRDIHWSGVGSVDLTQITWTPVLRLGDESVLKRDDKADDYEAAVRAYRQLAAQLRAQGMSEVADRFSYRAQVVQRRVLRKRRRWGRWFGTWLLDLISGHGYKPMRSVFTYALVVLGFASVYYLLGNSVHPALAPLDALIFSVTSFHGRGFTPGELVTLHNPLTVLAAGEAIVGLLIEITFIATFTQRFFAR